MMNLAEYRRRTQSLADFLPWAALVGTGVVLNKDGSFQRTRAVSRARSRFSDAGRAGRDHLRGSTMRCAASAPAGRSSSRRSACPRNRYPESAFPDPASWLVDAERRAQFEEEGAHFESRYFLTLLWLPPADDAARAESWLYEGRTHAAAPTGARVLDGFIDRTDRVLGLLDGFMPEADWLDDAETLTYLHSCISTTRQPVRVPETPMYLDALLADRGPDAAASSRCSARAHLRTLTILGFPSQTWPGLLDDLNRLAFPYRWVTRAICLDKTEATKVLGKHAPAMVRQAQVDHGAPAEVMTNEASVLIDSDADNKAVDADAALQELGSDLVGVGYFTATVTVWDEDAADRRGAAASVERAIQGRDFTCIRETRQRGRGLARQSCPAMSTPMSASRWSRR